MPATSSPDGLAVSRDDTNLDVLRAFAVLHVLAFHTLAMWNTSSLLRTMGQMGVYLFFVHTALVLTASMSRLVDRYGATLGGWVARFYIKRAFRLYPLAWVAIALYVAGQVPPSTLLMNANDAPLVVTPAILAANLTLSQNLLGQSNVAAVLWSLPLEVQMYVLLPACFLLVRRGTRAVVAGLIVAIVLGLAFFTFQESIRGLWRLSVIGYGPCFLAGVLAYTLLQRAKRRAIPAWIWPFVIPLWGALCIAAFRLDYDNVVKGWVYCLGIGLLIPLTQSLPRSWFTRAAAQVAKYSYGIYLFHVPVLTFSFRWLDAPTRLVNWFVFAVLIVAIPVGVYHLVEHPAIRLGERVSAARRTTEPAPDTAALAGVP